MIPLVLTSYSDAELLRFIEDRSDPLIAELCRRVEGLEFGATIRELEEQVERYENEESDAERELATAETRIEVLEEVLRENKIAVPA